MSKKQKWISFGLIISGIILPALVFFVTNKFYSWLSYAGVGLSFTGLVLGFICMWKAGNFEPLRRIGLGFLIAAVIISVLYLVG